VVRQVTQSAVNKQNYEIQPIQQEWDKCSIKRVQTNVHYKKWVSKANTRSVLRISTKQEHNKSKKIRLLFENNDFLKVGFWIKNSSIIYFKS
jgi:hypothetical protein